LTAGGFALAEAAGRGAVGVTTEVVVATGKETAPTLGVVTVGSAEVDGLAAMLCVGAGSAEGTAVGPVATVAPTVPAVGAESLREVVVVAVAPALARQPATPPTANRTNTTPTMAGTSGEERLLRSLLGPTTPAAMVPDADEMPDAVEIDGRLGWESAAGEPQTCVTALRAPEADAASGSPRVLRMRPSRA
jgi:hypothetical protein